MNGPARLHRLRYAGHGRTPSTLASSSRDGVIADVERSGYAGPCGQGQVWPALPVAARRLHGVRDLRQLRAAGVSAGAAGRGMGSVQAPANASHQRHAPRRPHRKLPSLHPDQLLRGRIATQSSAWPSPLPRDSLHRLGLLGPEFRNRVHADLVPPENRVLDPSSTVPTRFEGRPPQNPRVFGTCENPAESCSATK